jgi:ubiquinone biosynthesis protein UbiJ
MANGEANFFNATLFAFANHVLNQNAWAREQLRGQAGRTIALVLGPARLALGIDAQGSFTPAEAGATADATLAISPLSLPFFLKPGADLDPHLATSGDPALCQLLHLLGKEFRWDMEEDLSHLVGDAAAHTLVGALHQAASGKVFGMEAGTTLSAEAFHRHADEVRALRERADALEQRLRKLES